MEILVFDAMVESGGGPAPSWTSGVDGHGTVLAFSWLPWPLDEIKPRRDGILYQAAVQRVLQCPGIIRGGRLALTVSDALSFSTASGMLRASHARCTSRIRRSPTSLIFWTTVRECTTFECSQNPYRSAQNGCFLHSRSHCRPQNHGTKCSIWLYLDRGRKGPHVG